MKCKTKVVAAFDSQYDNEYKTGDIGYIDGYLRGGDGVPYAAVVFGEVIHLAPLHHLKVRVPDPSEQ